MTHVLVFIGYEANDTPQKNQLLTQLKAVRGINVWSDDQIRPGANWEAETEQALAQAGIAILLITASFLGSDFLMDKIVPPLLRRQAEEGLIVLPLIAKPCAWQATDWLAGMQ